MTTPSLAPATPSLEEDPILQVITIAKIFEVEQRTVREWLKTGRLVGFKTASGRWRIRQSEMVKFANEKYGSK